MGSMCYSSHKPQKQTVTRDSDGNIVSNVQYNQLAMLARCLPIFLLRVPKLATNKSKQQTTRRNCNLFLKGSWRSLVCKAKREFKDVNANMQKRASSHPVLPASATQAKELIILERARSLQYSRGMNLLRSPGLSADSGDQMIEALQRLHPSEQDHNIDTMSHHLSHPSAKFNSVITGPWLRKQIERLKRGTAVDQWG
jgi:hypothetical protein